MGMSCYLLRDFDISPLLSNEIIFILKAWTPSTFITGSFVLILCG